MSRRVIDRHQPSPQLRIVQATVLPPIFRDAAHVREARERFSSEVARLVADGVKMVNKTAGSTRILGHAVVTPGQPGWLDKLDAGLALKPESCKGYTVGDNTHKEISR